MHAGNTVRQRLRRSCEAAVLESKTEFRELAGCALMISPLSYSLRVILRLNSDILAVACTLNVATVHFFEISV